MKLDTKEFESKMTKSIEVYKDNLSVIRAGRASTAVVAKVMVDYYGVPTAITQMAEVKVADPKTLTITPWDGSLLKPIEKAIQTSDLGINPQNDGRIIRLVFPQLTEERRKSLNALARFTILTAVDIWNAIPRYPAFSFIPLIK